MAIRHPAILAKALLLVALAACGAASTEKAATTSTAANQAHDATQTAEPRRAPPAPAKTPTETSDISTIAKVEEETKPRTATEEAAPPKQIGARHVLVQWMGSERASQSILRTREQALLVIRDVYRRAKAGEDLGRLAVEYSDEPNAGARGGSLGRFGRGQMVGPFEAAVFKLKVGEISDIVETPFGFHVIQRTE